MKPLVYCLFPLTILLILASIACVLGYFILMTAGDIVEARKLISKLTLVMLILCIFPVRKFLNLEWAELGFVNPRRFIQQIGIGLLLGIASLLPILLILYALDIHVWDTQREWTWGKATSRVLIALFLALLISFAEEPLFRGTLLTGLRRKMSAVLAIGVSSLYYAALHFLKGKTDVPYHEITFLTGFELMAEAFANWLNPEIVSALFSLFIVGVFLAIIRTEFKQTMGVCVGCHAAWVWQIKTSKDFFNTDHNAEYYYLVSSYDGVVGPLVTVWLSLAIAGYYFWKKQTASKRTNL